ncbi:MAG: hypothetical protein AAFZ18_34425, partial [Myxococcota bacterium]
ELLELDPSNFLRWLIDLDSAAVADAAATFHARLATGFADVIRCARDAASDVELAGLSGGVAVNETFALQLREAVEDQGLGWREHEKVPPNDGGLALGQAAVLAHTLR